MPIYDLKCPHCGHIWEARIYRSSDKDSEKICHICGTEADLDKDKRLPENTSFKIAGGYAARNGYGLKKFNDGN